MHALHTCKHACMQKQLTNKIKTQNPQINKQHLYTFTLRFNVCSQDKQAHTQTHKQHKYITT